LAALCGGALFVAMLWAYWPTLSEVFDAWMNQPDYSHGFLVAPLAIAFLVFRRDSFPATSARPSWAGLGVLLGVAAVRLFAGRFYLLPVDAWTIPLWVAGCVWLLFGMPCLRWSLPSIVFLWFMFPMPYSAERWLSVPLQTIATKVSTTMLVMLGQPAISEGNVIWLEDQQLNVAEACSGLRILMCIFALAFAFVLFSRWAWWQKALALIAALPVAIVANATRIVVTGLLTQLWSSEAAHKFSHDLAGLVMIPFAALLFWLFLTYLERVYPEVEMVSPLRRPEPERA
jgi:exosortase